MPEDGARMSEWITTTQLAAAVGVSAETVRQWAMSGRVPVPGGTTRRGARAWPRGVVLDWAARTGRHLFLEQLTGVPSVEIRPAPGPGRPELPPPAGPADLASEIQDDPGVVPSVVLRSAGEVDRRWLAGVSWRTPAPAGAEWLARCVGLPVRAVRQAGYDPLGRLALSTSRSPGTSTASPARFALQYPVGPPTEPFDDEDLVMTSASPARGGSGLVCVERCRGPLTGVIDLLPSPWRWPCVPLFVTADLLAEAIGRAVASATWAGAQDRTAGMEWLVQVVSAPSWHRHFRLQVGEVRARLGPNRGS